MGIKDKIRNAHEYISNSYYLNHPNLKINEEKWNEVILMTLLTGLNGGKELLIGNYGSGKTTVAEAVSSLLYGYPPEFIQACELKGHPYQTEEKMAGRPNLGELQKGNEKVIWSNFSKAPIPKIVDEISRLSGGAQDTLLDSIDRGVFSYLNETLFQNGFGINATANYPDSGNTEIIPPLLDRFDVGVEIAAPIGLTMYRDSAKENKKMLKNKKISIEMLEALKKDDYHKIGSLKEIYLSELGELNELIFTEKEIKKCREKINNISFGAEAPVIIDVLYSEANSLTKVPGEAYTEHYDKTNLAGILENNISYRWINSINEYSKSLTFALGENEVTPKRIYEIIPHTLLHRVKIKDGFSQKNSKDDLYPGSQQKWNVDKLTDKFRDNYLEKRDVYLEFYGKLINGEDLSGFINYDLPVIRSILYREGIKEKGN